VFAYLTIVAMSYLRMPSPWIETAGLTAGVLAVARATGQMSAKGLFIALAAFVGPPLCIGAIILLYLNNGPTGRL
jgi:hypothetical protein